MLPPGQEEFLHEAARLEAGETAILDDRDGATSRDAERAIGVNAPQFREIGHGV